MGEDASIAKKSFGAHAGLCAHAHHRVVCSRKDAENSWKMFFALRAAALKATTESVVDFSRVRRPG